MMEMMLHGVTDGEERLCMCKRRSNTKKATVQAYFKLQRPAFELLPYTTRLEYSINEEIRVPFFKVLTQIGLRENLLELKKQLRIGLQLVPTEMSSLNPAYSEPPLATSETYFSPSVSPLPSDSYATRGLDKWIVERAS